MENKEENNEIEEEIDNSLKDQRGVLSHQKRLGFCLSAGICDLLEKYLKKENMLKTGYKINHQWLKKKKENIKKILAEKVSGSLESLHKLDRILDVAFKIENKRNELVYGGKATEKELIELVNDYLNIKKEVEK